MISFASFPAHPEPDAYGGAGRDPDDEDDMDVDFQDDEFDVPVRKLTSPGEVLTSSHAYMRCVLLSVALASLPVSYPVQQWTRYIC